MRRFIYDFSNPSGKLKSRMKAIDNLELQIDLV